MRYVRLGGSDLEVSVLGLGCGSFGGIGSAPELFGRGEDQATAFTLMDAAYEQALAKVSNVESDHADGQHHAGERQTSCHERPSFARGRL